MQQDELIGKEFGWLTVIGLDEEQKQADKFHRKHYKCQCRCGNVVTLEKCKLKYKNIGIKSCGCQKQDNNKQFGREKSMDLIGQKFGKLTVTKPYNYIDGDPKTRKIGAWWYCDCDCGNKDVVAKGAYLRAGRIKSCGCLNLEMSHLKNTINLTGQRYGMLTVIEEQQNMKDVKNKGTYWRCVCDCGNETIVSSNQLRTGGTMSCGCLQSKNELLIKQHLGELGIKYIPQYWFDDLVSPETGYRLKYDVAVVDDNNNLVFLIEYDGEQHEYGSRFSPNPEVNKMKFERMQLYDKMKNQYCIDHNIDLLRISFRHKKDLNGLLDEKLKQKGLI